MSILFSMTTYSARAPYIGATLGSLLAVPDSSVIISCTPECNRLIPWHISDRLHWDNSLPWKCHSYRKYFGDCLKVEKEIDEDVFYEHSHGYFDVIFTADDDHNYQVADVLAVAEAVRKEPDKVFQARGNGGIFKPGRNPPELKWFTCHSGGPTVPAPKQTQIVFGGSLAGYSRQVWSILREQMLAECLSFDEDENLADDYTASRILAKMKVPIWALPIQFVFPHTQAMPIGETVTAIDPLHRRLGGNVARYLKIAKRDYEKGDVWWEPMVTG